MNKQQIKADLRRSACEDKNAFLCHHYAFTKAAAWKDVSKKEYILQMKNDDWRIFFLLVAEAL